MDKIRSLMIRSMNSITFLISFFMLVSLILSFAFYPILANDLPSHIAQEIYGRYLIEVSDVTEQISEKNGLFRIIIYKVTAPEGDQVPYAAQIQRAPFLPRYSINYVAEIDSDTPTTLTLQGLLKNHTYIVMEQSILLQKSEWNPTAIAAQCFNAIIFAIWIVRIIVNKRKTKREEKGG